MATKDPLPIETVDETIGRETTGKGEFEPFQKRLKIFHDITGAIGNIFDLDALLKEIIQIVFGMFPHAGRCFVALQDSDETQLTIRTIYTKDHTLTAEGNVMSQTLAQRAISERKSLLIMDTQMDSRVSTSIKIIGARSIMCAPLVCPQKR